MGISKVRLLKSFNSGLKATSALVTATSVLAMCMPAGASAQTLDAAPDDSALTTGEIVVTGSHIRGNANSTSSAPITTVGQELMQGTASISIEDTLNRVPSITSDLSASSNNTSSGGAASNVGVATVSLRNLGSARTLVLVNGRRFVSGVSANSGYGVDLNAIPTAIIDHVDVLTGGQSAIYGSDAIAGVINIVTKRKFDGLEMNAFAGISEEGDAGRQNFDITYGRNFGFGNVWISGGYSKQEPLRSSQRAFSRDEQRFVDADKDGIIESIAVRDGPAHVPGASLFVNKLAIFGNGSRFNTYQPLLDSNYNRSGDTDWDNQNASRYLISPYKRYYVASGMTFDVGSKSKLDIELNYTRTSAFSSIEPSPVSVVQDIFKVPQGGTTGIDIATSPYFVGSSAGAQLLAELGPNASLDQVQTYRRLVELGNRTVSNKRETFRVAAAFTHDFSSTLSLNTSAVYGVTSQTQVNTGDFSIEAFRNAMTIESDGRGGYQCANAQARLAGCVPINPFNTTDSLAGKAGITGISDAAVKYLSIATGQTSEIQQFVFNSTLSGELPFSISDDPIGFAAGIEYRKEQAEEIPDAYRQKGLSRELQISAIKGSFDVKEAFAELNVPIAKWLTLSAAGRLGDYSTVGTTFTYRFGMDAPVMDAVRFRASWSRSVRAPNINDLFSNGTTSTAGVTTDVCNGITAASTGNIAVNCRSIPAIANRIADTGSFTLISSEANNTRLLLAGSQNIKEETADTLTLGVVFTPIRRVSLSVDFYDINIRDGITRLSSDVFVQRCYNVDPSAFDATCGGTLDRDVNDGPILNLRTPLINAANIKTRGIDAELAYTARGLNLSLQANYLDRYNIIGATGTNEVFDGRPQYPRWRLTGNASYDITSHLNFFAQVRYRSETKAYLTKNNYSDSLNTLKDVVYSDVRLAYRFGKGSEFYLGVNNLFNVDPDILMRDPATGTNTEPRVYDVIGRQFFAGFKAKF